MILCQSLAFYFRMKFVSSDDLNHYVKMIQEDHAKEIQTFGAGHLLFQNATKDEYKRVRCSSFPSGAKMRPFVHQAILLHKMKLLNIPKYHSSSHLCHIPNCINPDHLVLEPSHVNNDRQRCNNERGVKGPNFCWGHGVYGHCLPSN